MTPNYNPLFDGTLSLKVAGVEWVGVNTFEFTDCTDAGPGGDASLAFTLYLSAADDPFALAANHNELAIDAAVVLSHGPGTTLFSGRICSDPTVGYAGETAYVEVECQGLLGVCGQRQDFLYFMRDESYDGWLLHRVSNKAVTFDNVGRVYLSVPASTVCPADFIAAAYYMPLGGLSADHIGYLTFDWSANLGNSTAGPPTDWGVEISGLTAYDEVLNDYSGAASDFFQVGIPGGGAQGATGLTVAMPYTMGYQPTKLAALVFEPNSAMTPNFAPTISITNLTAHRGGVQARITAVGTGNPATVTASHGLANGTYQFVIGGCNAGVAGGTVSGAYTVTVTNSTHFTIPVNVTSPGNTGYCCQMISPRVDTVMTEIATGTGLATTSSVTQVGSTLGEAIIRDATTRADALATIASLYSGRIDWGFRGTNFYCAPMKDPTADRVAIRALSNCYLIDATVPGISYDVRLDPESDPDYIRVLYACLGDAVYPDGTLCSVIKPSDPGWAAATARVLELDYSSMSMSATQAGYVASQALLWYAGANSNNLAGTITIATPTTPIESGGTVKTPYIRSGDWIEEVHVKALDSTKSLLYITGRTIDMPSGAVSLTIGGRGDEFAPQMPPVRRAQATHKPVRIIPKQIPLRHPKPHR